MKKCLLLVLLPFLVFSCKSKKLSLAENDEKLETRDLIEFFQPLKLPYLVSDTLLRRKEAEGVVINYKLFVRLVPDTVLTRFFGKEGRPHLYAVGKVKVPDSETYLFVKATTRDRKILFVLCFDKADHFAVARPVIYNDNEPGVSGMAGIDAKYTLTVNHERKGSDGQLLYKRDAYVYTASGGFVLILTESNENKTRIPPIYDPIDTLSHKHKFTGNYAQDRRNIMAFRDGKDPSRILFFVHFEKEEGTCTGELKGEARFVSANIARYKSNSDPCAIEFSFNPSGVTMKELGGCGVHRDIKCFFEGYFEKRAIADHAPVGHNRPKAKTPGK
ncbi:MAG TPA: hypothetical protein VNU72_14100 [Puia sp.]|nr:hypothetical protein [Puia sp.]